jgi:lipoprotein NlpD
MKRFCVLAVPTLALAACGYGFERDDARYPASGVDARSGSNAASGAVLTPSRPLGADEYLVQPGDTLFAIGFRNQQDYHDLANWNGIGMDYKIRAGQIIRLTPPGGQELSTQPLVSAPPVLALPKPIPAGASTLPGPVTQPPKELPPAPVPSVPPAAKQVPIGPVTVRWQWPTSGQVIKTYSTVNGSKGLDISGEVGQPIQAVAAGKVVYSGSALKGYGELIIVKHDETYLSAYGYNRRRLVKEGDEVRPGQTIAELGIGPEQKPELHFEIRENGKPVDPMRFLPAR